ncbi:hypothetical protein [Mucilaginibacter flavidus]|uniref:hypothetical protein n=1 Tax=Mucilaginibacter flavidus TaxID=2949309 RepID=UPI002093D7D6|nr:hypothetical protein [Mucilaginibacter flavidus]MCO5945693.1 hypothetical protein [Mucilaginibacter flavidus]
MKRYTLLLAMCIAIGFYGCKKDIGSVSSGELVGKWHQTKLNLHETIGSTVVHDTTFMEDSFTSADFYQFNIGKTATISKSGNFGFGGKIIAINADVLFDWVTHYTYSVADSTLTLKVTDIPAQITINSNGLPYNQSPTVVQLDNSHLVLRNVYNYNPASAGQAPSALTTTLYFTRE